MNEENMIPPHAVGVEKSILSVLMKYPDRMDDAADLTSEYFHVPAHRTLFVKITEMLRKGQQVDILTLIQKLADEGKLDEVGREAGVAEIYTHAYNDNYFHLHIEELRDKFARRMALRLGGEIQRLAFEAETAMEIVEATSKPITEIHDVVTQSKPARTTREVLLECLSRFEQLVAGKVQPMGIETSLVEINQRFKGLQRGHTIVISGYPSGGKTTLACQLAMDAALAGNGTLVCSMEMSEAQILNRMLAYVAKLPVKAITSPSEYSREVWDAKSMPREALAKIKSAFQSIGEAPFSVESSHGSNVNQITASIRRAHRGTPLSVVVVDFVQKINATPDMRRESREQQLSYAVNHLADLARELGICMILPSQLNKDGAAKHAEAINEAADLHLQIVQDRRGNPPSFEHLGLGVVKDRHFGQMGELLEIVLDGPMSRFVPKMRQQ